MSMKIQKPVSHALTFQTLIVIENNILSVPLIEFNLPL